LTKLAGIYGVTTLLSSLRRSHDRLTLRKLGSLYLPTIFANFVWLPYSLCSLLLIGCVGGDKLTQVSGKTMGTTYTVKAYTEQLVEGKPLKVEIDELLKKINLEMSTYIAESEISYFNKFDRLGSVKVSDDFFFVTKYSLSLAHQTTGLYDPTIGPLVNLWGFGPDGKRKVPSDEQIRKAKALVGFQHISLNEKDKSLSKKIPGVYLDLSSSAKGFAVDKIASLLKSKKIINFMVEIGGEIKTSGTKNKKPWLVAVEVPAQDQEAEKVGQKIIELNNMSIATSGSYRNYFKRKNKTYSHTIDYRTGKPVEHFLVSVSILSPKGCMQADALATALMVMGPDRAYEFAQKEKIAAYFIYKKDDKLMTRQSLAFETYLGVGHD
jgi:thiamine biosynthesis lipoprotein